MKTKNILIFATCLIFLFGKFSFQSAHQANYLILNFFQTSQRGLEKFIKDFSRKRDLFKTQSNTLTQIGGYSGCLRIIAEYENLTLVTRKYAAQNLKPSQLTKSSFVDPVVWAIPNATYTLINLTFQNWQKSRQHKITILQVPGLGLNFGYCEKLTFANIRPWSIEILTFPLQKETWLALFAVTALTIISYDWVYKASYKIDMPLIYLLICSLLSTSLANFRSMPKTMFLFVWIISNYIISIFYAASVTSVILVPSEEHSWGYLRNMVDQNYSQVIRHEMMINFLKAATLSNLKSNTILTKNNELSDTQKDLNALLKSINKTFPPNITDTWAAEKHAVNQIAYGTKTFIVDSWPSVIYMINQAIKLLREKPRQETKIRCHLGKTVIAKQNVFSVYHSPESSKVDWLARQTMDSGLFMYWWKEMIELRYSERVQDRMRVVSPTKIVHGMNGNSMEAPKISGYISSVFCLWVTCALICLLALGIENLVFYQKTNSLVSFIQQFGKPSRVKQSSTSSVATFVIKVRTDNNRNIML